MALSENLNPFRDMLSLGSGWGNISGPGLFMAKAFFSGGVKGVIFGLAGASGFAFMYGTAALPFAVSASIGFAIGAIGYYRDVVTKALLAIDRYPMLLRLHLQTNFPAKRFDLWESQSFRSQEFQRSWILSSMLVAGYMSAEPAIERITQGEEEAMISDEINRQSWKR